MTGEIINIVGWKGKGEYKIAEKDDTYYIKEWRKSKTSGEVYAQLTKIPRRNVQVMTSIILSKCELGRRYTYRFLVQHLLDYWHFHVNKESFNGGKYRNLYYFPYYYYPLKVLEKRGIIKYHGRGGITVIKRGLEK